MIAYWLGEHVAKPLLSRKDSSTSGLRPFAQNVLCVISNEVRNLTPWLSTQLVKPKTRQQPGRAAAKSKYLFQR
jgi:hypothetical protein